MSKEWRLEDEGYIVEEMLIRGSVAGEGGSWEVSEAETEAEEREDEGLNVADPARGRDSDRSEICRPWELRARGDAAPIG